MATKFSDIATQAAYGNSIKVQRYHGASSNTLIANVTLSDLGSAANNVVYLCPIPWYSRIQSISVVWNVAAKYVTTNPKGTLCVRSMKDKNAKTATDLTSLDYTPILGTANDYNSATDKKLLSGISLSDNNTTEIPIANNVNILTTADTSAVTADISYPLAIPYETRLLTLSECYSYTKNVTIGSQTSTAVVFADNAKELAAKEHYGMLTWVCSAAGTGDLTDGNALISICYIDPAPSGTAQGSLTRNGSSI